MDKAKISKYLWITAAGFVTLAVLSEYKLVVIKGVSNYNFEYLLVGIILVVILKFLKK